MTEKVICPKCEKRCNDFTPEADFIGWHGECVECYLREDKADEL